MRPSPSLTLAMLFLGTSFPVLGQLVSDGATRIINGVTANVTTDLDVGVNSGPTTLIITNGGVVNVSSNSYLGVNAGSSGNLVQVTGANSQWSTAGSETDGSLTVGAAGAQNTVVVNRGAALSSQTGYLGYSSSSASDLVLVTGTGSVWNNSQFLSVGYFGVGCQLVVSNGAMVEDLVAYIGKFAPNNVAVVTGTNSAWRTDQALFVGGTGAGNQLIVSNGATVLAATNLVIGPTGLATNNQIRVVNANLIVTNAGHTATFQVLRGTNIFNGGVVDVDQLQLPNPGAAFVFNSGELRVTQSQVSNSAPFIVGNGASGAMLTLRGGTNTFANGLIISSNATLIGCGTINGFVVNYGTVLSSCPGGTLTFGGAVTNYTSIAVTNGGQIRFLGPVVNLGMINTGAGAPQPPVLSAPRFFRSFNFSFPSQNGFSYVVEFKNGIYDPAWTTLTTMTGSGASMTVRDDHATNSSRLYRVRTSSGAVAPILHPNGFANSFRFDFLSQQSFQYFVEFKTQLQAVAWSPLTNFPGSGGMFTVFDTAPAGPSRFYRVRAQ